MQSWDGPVNLNISSDVTWSAALAITLLRTSPTPIGLTPGDLSRKIRRHASKLAMPCGSTNSEHRHFAILPIDAQRSSNSLEKDKYSLFHPMVSNPDGPAEPDTEQRINGIVVWLREGSQGKTVHLLLILHRFLTASVQYQLSAHL